MYAELLDRAFGRRPKAASPPTTTEAITVVRHCRTRLAETPRTERPTNWAADALANQMAYDVALIELARSVGLACDPDTFDRPELRRREVRSELAARGVHVDHTAMTG